MDEYGEAPAFYIWPQELEVGEPFPDDFNERVRKGLASVGLESERA